MSHLNQVTFKFQSIQIWSNFTVLSFANNMVFLDRIEFEFD